MSIAATVEIKKGTLVQVDVNVDKGSSFSSVEKDGGNKITDEQTSKQISKSESDYALCSYCNSKLSYVVGLSQAAQGLKQEEKDPNTKAVQVHRSIYSIIEELFLMRQQDIRDLAVAMAWDEEGQATIERLEQEQEDLRAQTLAKRLSAEEVEQLQKYRKEHKKWKEEQMEKEENDFQRSPAEVENLRKSNKELETRLAKEREELASLTRQTQKLLQRYQQTGKQHTDSSQTAYYRDLQTCSELAITEKQQIAEFVHTSLGANQNVADEVLNGCMSVTEVLVLSPLRGSLLRLHEAFCALLSLPPLSLPPISTPFHSSSGILNAVIANEASLFPSGFVQTLPADSPVFVALAYAQNLFQGKVEETNLQSLSERVLRLVEDIYALQRGTLTKIPKLISYVRSLLSAKWRSHLYSYAWTDEGLLSAPSDLGGHTDECVPAP